MEVNLKGYFAMIREAAPHLCAAGLGCDREHQLGFRLRSPIGGGIRVGEGGRCRPHPHRGHGARPLRCAVQRDPSIGTRDVDEGIRRPDVEVDDAHVGHHGATRRAASVQRGDARVASSREDRTDGRVALHRRGAGCQRAYVPRRRRHHLAAERARARAGDHRGRWLDARRARPRSRRRTWSRTSPTTTCSTTIPSCRCSSRSSPVRCAEARATENGSGGLALGFLEVTHEAEQQRPFEVADLGELDARADRTVVGARGVPHLTPHLDAWRGDADPIGGRGGRSRPRSAPGRCSATRLPRWRGRGARSPSSRSRRGTTAGGLPRSRRTGSPSPPRNVATDGVRRRSVRRRCRCGYVA